MKRKQIYSSFFFPKWLRIGAAIPKVLCWENLRGCSYNVSGSKKIFSIVNTKSPGHGLQSLNVPPSFWRHFFFWLLFSRVWPCAMDDLRMDHHPMGLVQRFCVSRQLLHCLSHWQDLFGWYLLFYGEYFSQKGILLQQHLALKIWILHDPFIHIWPGIIKAVYTHFSTGNKKCDNRRIIFLNIPAYVLSHP